MGFDKVNDRLLVVLYYMVNMSNNEFDSIIKGTLNENVISAWNKGNGYELFVLVSDEVAARGINITELRKYVTITEPL